ncbi:LOW QUALITY PROTEIN: hypothetical protein CFOL_v3_35410, partial [Cephalotus follicularis]
TKQGSKTVTEYDNTLQNLWQELYHYRVFEMKCPKDAATLKIFIEERVYDFLAGLNPEFDQVTIQILRKEEIPSLEETISLIQAKESRRGIMLEPQALEGSALVTHNAHPNKKKKERQMHQGLYGKTTGTIYGLRLKVNTYCNKSRHTRDRCCKLNGKPITSSREWGNRVGQPRSQAHLTEQTSHGERHEKEGFNSEEIERIRNLLGSLEKHS